MANQTPASNAPFVKKVFKLHNHPGILAINPEMLIKDKQALALAYTPGIAYLVKAIQKEAKLKNKYTMSGKLVGVFTDGTAVLGLGNVGAKAGLPVVEGKALLYKDLAQVNAIPMALANKSALELSQSIANISDSYAAIHLEDIAAPKCFTLENLLKSKLDIPVYHDDQEGTAIVVLAALINAAKLVKKNLTDLKVVINGVGAAGLATAQLLKYVGIKHLTLVDKLGVINSTKANPKQFNVYQNKVAQDLLVVSGTTLAEVIKDKDVFIGLSVASVLSAKEVKMMAKQAIVFALANPSPEIIPQTALASGAAIVATGSSQYPNQVNNVVVFPGLMKGLLNSKIKQVTLGLESFLAQGLAQLVNQPSPTNIIPNVFRPHLADQVAQQVQAYL